MRAFRDPAATQVLQILGAALSLGLATILTLYHFGASLWLAIVIGALVGFGVSNCLLVLAPDQQ